MNSKIALQKTALKNLFSDDKITKEELELMLARLEKQASFLDEQKNKRKELIKKARYRIFEHV
ncbi:MULTISPECIES: hypothetical protein [Bacillus]|uniref:hypothetical protein n=1 Tax=Bacillus TaxID=1386 RepID=UPI002165F8EC|nr:hypothetical protein [Bacillus subtilis]MCY8983542.1 hypothetical protein [Bacillus subtilis]UVV88257.1 hypothetical protein NX810_15315 [Bacillus subtilis]